MRKGLVPIPELPVAISLLSQLWLDFMETLIHQTQILSFLTTVIYEVKFCVADVALKIIDMHPNVMLEYD